MKENRYMNHIIEFVNQSKQMLIEHGECCLTAATGWENQQLLRPFLSISMKTL